jgi:kynurenine formamidase
MKRANLLAGMRIVDLSATLSEDMPCTWPGHFPYGHRKWKDFKDPSVYKTSFIIMDEHCGTHFDAKLHFIPEPDTQTGDQVELKRLTGPAVVIDVRDYNKQAKPGESPWIPLKQIQDWEQEYGLLESGDIVLFLTGWDRYYREDEKGYNYLYGPVRDQQTPGWPSPELEVVLYLAEKGIISIGTDAPSLGSVQNGAPVHQEGLRRGLSYIEGLAGLDQLPPVGAFFLFLPLKISGSTGCPGRAVAILPEGV